MRPERGRAEVVLPGGLEIVVLGPDLDRLKALHKFSPSKPATRGHARSPGRRDLPERHDRNCVCAVDSPRRRTAAGECIPSANAQAFATAAYLDRSVPNLASTILLFRYKGRSFLFTGDARGDLIFEGLSAARLLDADGRASVD